MTEERARRLPRGTLSEGAVLEAAMQLLERDGVEGLTMRALAERLGAAPTAVYRYFRTKDELLAGLTECVLEQLPPVPAGAHWTVEIAHVARALRDVLARFPGADALLVRSPYSAASAGVVEQLLERMLAAGLDEQLAVDAVQTTVTYALGTAAQHVPGEPGFWPEIVDAARPARQFPVIHRTAGSWTRTADEHFEAGIAILVEGLRAHASSRAAARRPGST